MKKEPSTKITRQVKANTNLGNTPRGSGFSVKTIIGAKKNKVK